MAIRFLKVPENEVPVVSGPSLFVDTDGTPKLKLEDGSVAELLPITATKVELNTGEPIVVEDATAVFGKDYDGVVELAVRRGSGPVTRLTQGTALVGGASSYFAPGSQQTADISVIIPAAPVHTVIGTADIGGPGGLIEITTAAAHGMITGAIVDISGVLGTTDANNSWTITVTGLDTFTLDGSIFGPAPWMAGGTQIAQQTTVNPVVVTGITLLPPLSVWCVFQCHFEFVFLNENYQSGPPDYDDMRGFTMSGDISFLFNDGGGTPDTRYVSGGAFTSVAIIAQLEGSPVLPALVAPLSSSVSSLGALTLDVINDGAQKYWFASRWTVSPPITVPGP